MGTYHIAARPILFSEYQAQHSRIGRSTKLLWRGVQIENSTPAAVYITLT